MFSSLKNWRRRRILRKHRIPDDLWASVTREVHSVRHLFDTDLARLNDLSSLLLYEKAIEPAHGLEITESMRARIGCLAALPVLNLGLDYYRPWYSIVVYAEPFVSRDYYQDEAGVIHSQPEVRSGEAWGRGPVVISWEDVVADEPGYNVIIHEMAHKLDLLDGVANGFPVLHAGMDQSQWTETFSAAYESLLEGLDSGQETAIDEYAAASPAEFFAVASEAFFETPRVLQTEWPDVYEQLALYYRQRP